jgi:ribosome-associated protein
MGPEKQMAREARATTKQLEKVGSGITALEAAQMAANAGLEKKAEQVALIDVRGLASYTDFIVLMNAASDRQVNAVADAVDDQLRKNGYRPIGVEGVGAGNWVLIDAGDVVIHVFQEDARAFYDLDRLWADAKRVEVETPAAPATASL